jgi:hypothetical protein
MSSRLDSGYIDGPLICVGFHVYSRNIKIFGYVCDMHSAGPTQRDTHVSAFWLKIASPDNMGRRYHVAVGTDIKSCAQAVS